MKRIIRKRRKDGVVQRYHVGRLRVINRGVKRKNYGMAFKMTAGTPLPDHPESYGYKGKRVAMTPDEFMDITQQEAFERGIPQKSREEYEADTVTWYESDPPETFSKKEKIEFKKDARSRKEYMKKLSKAIASSVPEVDTPWLENVGGKWVGHEGRHRAVATKMAGVKKMPVIVIEKNYGSGNYVEIDDPEYIAASQYEGSDKKYGKVKRISGKKAGALIAASGVAVPVILPAPLMAALGATTAKKVDNIKFILTDEHDKKKRFPGIMVEGRR